MQRRGKLSNAAFRQALDLAAEGRRAAIYERTTGLYAYWYLQLRVENEIVRAEGGGKPLSCISLWADAPERNASLATNVRESLRFYDMAAYLNNGHFVIVLLDAGEVGVQVVLQRIALAMGDHILVGSADYPEDGCSFEELFETAKARAVRTRTAA